MKVVIVFRGREMAHHELGFKLLQRIKEDVGEDCKVESFPSRLEGRHLVMMLAPKKKPS